MARSEDDIKKATKKADDTYNDKVSELISDDNRAKKEASSRISSVAQKLLAQAKSKGGNKNSSEILKGAEALIMETVGEVTKDLAELITGYNKKEIKLKERLAKAQTEWAADNSEANAKALSKLQDAIEQITEELAEDIDFAAKQGERGLEGLTAEVATAQKLANTKMGEKLGAQMRKSAVTDTLSRKKEFLENRNSLKEGLKNQKNLLKELGPGNEELLDAITKQLEAAESKDFEKFSKLEKVVDAQKKSLKDDLLKQYLERAKEYKKESLARRALGATLGGGVDKIGSFLKEKSKDTAMAGLNKLGNIGLGPLNLRNITKGLIGTAKFGKGLIEKRQAAGIYDRSTSSPKGLAGTPIAALPAIGSTSAPVPTETLALPAPASKAQPISSEVTKVTKAAGSGSLASGATLDEMRMSGDSRDQITELRNINKTLRKISSQSSSSSGGLGGVLGAVASLIEGSAFLKLASRVKGLLGFGTAATAGAEVAATAAGAKGFAATLAGLAAPIAVISAAAVALVVLQKKAKDNLKDIADKDPNDDRVVNNAEGRVITGRAKTSNEAGVQLSNMALKTLQPGTAKKYLAAGPDAKGRYLDGYSKEELETMAAGKAIKAGTLERFATPKVAAPDSPVVAAAPTSQVSAPIVSQSTVGAAVVAAPVMAAQPVSRPAAPVMAAAPAMASQSVSAPSPQVPPKPSAPTLATSVTPSSPARAATGSSLPVTGADGGVKGGGATAMGSDLKSVASIGGNVDMAGLDPAMRNNFTAMAAEYQERTGKKLKVNSAFRSFGKQKELYDGFKAGKPGYNPAAPPGSSLHEHGYAIDADPAQVDELKKMGLVSKYGFEGIAKAGERQHLQVAGGQKAIASAKSGLISGDTGGGQNSLNGMSAAFGGTGDVTVTAAAESVKPSTPSAVRSSASPVTAKVEAKGEGSDGASKGGSNPGTAVAGNASKPSRGGTVTASSMSTFSFMDPGMFAINVGASA